MTLGGRTVEEWKQAMSSREYTRWQIYLSQEPPLWERINYYCANIAATIANAFRSRGRRYKVTDFLLKFGDQPRRDTPEALEAKMMMFAKIHNKRFKESSQ